MSKICPKCTGQMDLLLTSWYCKRCDTPKSESDDCPTDEYGVGEDLDALTLEQIRALNDKLDRMEADSIVEEYKNSGATFDDTLTKLRNYYGVEAGL